MNQNTIPALIIAIGLMVAALIEGGIYSFRNPRIESTAVIRTNRFTGTIEACAQGKCAVMSGPEEPK